MLSTRFENSTFESGLELWLETSDLYSFANIKFDFAYILLELNEGQAVNVAWLFD